MSKTDTVARFSLIFARKVHFSENSSFRENFRQTKVPPPPLQVEFHSLVNGVLITPKGTESPDSRHIGVIGALVLILPSETV